MILDWLIPFWSGTRRSNLYIMYNISANQRKAIVGCLLDSRIIPRRVICYLNHNDPFRFLAKEKAQSKICAQARVLAACVWSTPQEDPVVRMQVIPPSTNTPQPVFVTSQILQNPEVSFHKKYKSYNKVLWDYCLCESPVSCETKTSLFIT